jgi:hypothetical protein
MNLFRRYAMVLAVVLVTGCAASGPKFAEVAQSFPPLKATEGRVVFFRSASMMGAAVRPAIRVDGEAVGKSSPGSFFYVDTPPGQHAITAATEAESVFTLDVAAAKTHYISSAITMGALVGHVQFRQESEATAMSELASLSYIGEPTVGTGAAIRPTSVATSPAPSASTGTALTTPDALRAGDEMEYRVTDLYTKVSRPAIYRVDRIEGDRVIFNSGERVERINGELVSIGNAIGGDLDRASPPKGWAKTAMSPGQTWNVKYANKTPDGYDLTYQLRATVGSTTMLASAIGPQEVTLITYTGWVTQQRGGQTIRAKGNFKVWYSASLQRVVRLISDVDMLGGSTQLTLSSNEKIDLIALRRR